MLNFKDIGIENENIFGVSVSGVTDRLHIKEINLGVELDKKDYSRHNTANKGDELSVKKNYRVSGGLRMYASIRNMRRSFELITGHLGVTSLVGSSATNTIFQQENSYNRKSKSINIDRVVSQEKISGVIANKFILDIGAGRLLDIDLALIGKTKSEGVTMSEELGEIIDPLGFDKVKIYINNGLSLGNSPISLNIDSGSLSVSNNVKGVHRWHGNNDRTVAKFISGKPNLSGKFRILHTQGTTFVASALGVSYWFMRIEVQTDELISGVTPYMFRVDIPKVNFKSDIRVYQQGKVGIEDISYNGYYERGISYIWQPSIIDSF